MRIVSFFAGGGGLDLGFRQAGFDVVWANEFEPHCRAAYVHNHPDTKFVLGSGITRAMKSGARIDLCNDIDSDRFIATIWRDKNYTETTQISTSFTQKEGSTTQNSEITTQKEQSTTQKILELIRKNPTVKIQDIASAVSLTRDGVNYQIRQLKQQGKLRRVGGDNGGHWEIIER